MPSRLINLFVLLVCVHWLSIHWLADGLLLNGQLLAGEIDETAPSMKVQELLRSHCFACHGEHEPKVDLRLDSLKSDFTNDSAAAGKWQRVSDALRDEQMPPPDKKQPTAQEREWLVKWIEAKDLQRFAEASGVVRPPLRKLTRVEYQNTMRDLLGIEMDFAPTCQRTPSHPMDSPTIAGCWN